MWILVQFWKFLSPNSVNVESFSFAKLLMTLTLNNLHSRDLEQHALSLLLVGCHAVNGYHQIYTGHQI